MIELRDASIGYREPIVYASARFDGKYFLLGPNGSGKTTLFRGISGIAKRFSGEIIVEGSFPRLSTNLPEIVFVLPSKVIDLIDLRSDLMNADRSDIIEILKLLDLEILEKKVYNLSSGEKKGLANAIALGVGAKNILLDEPLEALDPYKKSKLLEYLDSYEATIILSTHETFTLEALKNRLVYLIFSGRLYGPFPVEDLLECGIVRGSSEEALVTIETPRGKVSLVKGSGKPLTSIYSMDMLYTLRAFYINDIIPEEVR